MARILIAEDDPLIASFLEKGLRAKGWPTVHVDNGHAAEELGASGQFDLLILDIGLPGKGGLEVLRGLRGRGHRVPVLVLTGRPQLSDVVDTLDLGADDYMTKPFRFEELLARVRARLRDLGTPQTHVISAGVVELDLLARRATVGGRPVELTAREFTLLEILARHPDQVLSREQLLSRAWGYDFDPTSNIINVYVSSLRKKLGTGVIETLRGFGYRMRTH
ncbi:response regulator transcription factor [Allorhizocola rhizosphaerae]|uniref:response regulator transcription factor n=1 Tax=Allorhizocola rhizosphaerae TaxID=1872709 RepID=UPI000E3E7D70|nr:response regulator transcription factor [Allorhizocola rhizosphaerae]